MAIISKFKNAWNAFIGRDPTSEAQYTQPQVMSSTIRPDRVRMRYGNERSIITTVYNKIAVDVSAVNLLHARVDSNNRFKERIMSGLNECLTLEANKDQSSRSFIQDIVMSMFDEGVVAVVPVDTDISIHQNNTFDILSMRTGRILEWYPDAVKVRLYNDRTGRKEELVLPKSNTAIIENPFYAVMNEPNSTAQRLIRKLALLDNVDEEAGSGKLNMLIQLPYVVKTEARRQQAENRRSDIERQLTESKFGIAYTDGTEKVIQLGRPLDSNMLEQVKYLKEELYNQLGLSPTIFDGTADEATMINYYNSTLEPILSAIVDEFKRKFLTKTARTQGQSIIYIREPFRLVPVSQLADIADKFTRNEILSTNEIRPIVGYKPVDDPAADELRNKNINQNSETVSVPVSTGDDNLMKGENQNG
jgi:hypothetical protein